MAARYFNWKLATVLLVAMGVFTVAAYALHRWQVGARAVQALPLGEAAYAKQDYDEAAVQLGKYLAVNADDIQVLLKYADAQLQRRPLSSNNIGQAITAYRTVLRLDSRHTEAARRLTEVYLWPMMGAPGEAELIARRYLEGSEDTGIRRMLADALWRQRKPNEAAAELTKILEKHPDDVLSYEKLGMLAEQNGEAAGKPAAAWFDDAVTKNPQTALAYIARAGFYLRRADRDKALADLEQAQKCDLPDTEARRRLVAGLINANRLDQAREQLTAWQAKEPAESQVWQYRAELAFRAEAPEEMYTVAQAGLKALAAQPWDFIPVATELLIRSNHLDEAKSCIAQLQQKDIAPHATAFLEGFVAERQGRLAEAVASWRKAIALGYRQPAAYMMLASALSRLGDTQSAVDQLRILVAENPNYLEGHLVLARSLVQARDWPAVLDEARQIQQLSRNHPEAIRLELQARAYLLAADTGPSEERDRNWQEIETRLTELEKTEAESLEVKLLHAQIVLIRRRLPEAASRLADLESKYPSDMRVALLQAELCTAQGRLDETKTRLQAAVTKFPQAVEPVRSLAVLLDGQGQRQECEAVLREGFARVQETRARRDVGLLLAEFYRRWKQDDKLSQWLTDLAAQFPSDIQPRRWLLTRPEILKDPVQAQKLVDEIKTLEGERGWQWRFEQARLWGITADDFQTHYPQIVKLLQENLLTNSRDYPSRLLLAETYERAKELPLAVAAYQEVLRLQPDNVQVYAQAIAALYKAKDNEAARRLLAEAEQRGLHSPALDQLRLHDDLQQRNYAQAENALEKMVSRDPNDTVSRLRLALVRIEAKKYDEAQEILNTLKAQMPDSMEVLGTQINLYVQQGKAEEAIRLCDQLVEKLHNAMAYTLRARVYIALRQNDKALEDYGRIIALDPQSAGSWASRADFYRVTGRVREGITDVRKALELAPDNVAIQKLAVLLFLAAGDLPLLAEAETILDKALATFRSSPPTNAEDPRMTDYAQLRMLKAQVLTVKGTGPGTTEARRLLHEVVDSQPKMAEAWQRLAQLELDQENPGQAADVALQGLSYNPENRLLLLLKARAEKVRQPTVAALTLKGFLDQNPGDVEVLIELADAYARSGRTQQAVDLLRQKLPELQGRERRRAEIALAEAVYANGQRDEAKTLFDTLMQADPNDATPTMSLAQQLRRERRWTEMNQLVRRWLGAHPQDADVATAIARVLASTGDRQALLMGEDILRTTLERNPRALSSLTLLAMMMQDAGRNEEAARLNRKILEIDPKSVVAMNNLAWILCDQETQPSSYREALELAQKGLAMASDNADLLDTRGYAYYRLGDFDKAIADFTKCMELYPANSPSSVTPRYHLAMTCAAMKRRAEAVAHLQKALDANRANVTLAREQHEAGRVTYAIQLLRNALRLQEQMKPLQASLGLADNFGLSAQEVTDNNALLERWQKGTDR